MKRKNLMMPATIPAFSARNHVFDYASAAGGDYSTPPSEAESHIAIINTGSHKWSFGWSSLYDCSGLCLTSYAGLPLPCVAKNVMPSKVRMKRNSNY